MFLNEIQGITSLLTASYGLLSILNCTIPGHNGAGNNKINGSRLNNCENTLL